MIVVVGAGPAGIAATLRVQECGPPVTVVDDNPAPGGQIWRGDATKTVGGATLLTGTRVVSIDAAGHQLLLESSGGATTLIYTKLILATGSRELFLPFPGWTLPGVFGAGGLQALVKSGLNVKGKRIVIAGTGPLLLAVAALLRKKGAEIRLIAEQTSLSALVGFASAIFRNPAKLLQGTSLGWTLAGVPYLTNTWVESADGTHLHLRKGNRRWAEEYDYAGIGYGLVPNEELHLMAGRSEDIIIARTGDVELATLEGAAAGYKAAGRPELAPDLSKARGFESAMHATFALRPELRSLAAPETLVCRCEDVTYARLQTHDSFRSGKLHTRCGMGPCQGRVCGAATKFLFGWDDTSVRPPAFPARIGTLATKWKES